MWSDIPEARPRLEEKGRGPGRFFFEARKSSADTHSVSPFARHNWLVEIIQGIFLLGSKAENYARLVKPTFIFVNGALDPLGIYIEKEVPL